MNSKSQYKSVEIRLKKEGDHLPRTAEEFCLAFAGLKLNHLVVYYQEFRFG